MNKGKCKICKWRRYKKDIRRKGFSFALGIFLLTRSLRNLAFWRSKWWRNVSLHKSIKTSHWWWLGNWDFDWNVTPEGGTTGFWSLPESPEGLGLTCEASKSPWEKAWYLGWLWGLWQSFQGRNEGCFPERWLKRNLCAQRKPQGPEGNDWYRRSQVADMWLYFCAPRGLRSQSKGSLWEFQQSELKDHRWSRLFLVCLHKWTGKIKSWTQRSCFNNDEGDLREKNCGLRKIAMLSVGRQNAAANCLESLFPFGSWNWVCNITKDVQFTGMKDLSNCHHQMLLQQGPCNWMFSQKTVSQA